MNDNQPAVVVKDLYKTFRLPHDQHSGLKQLIVNFSKRKKGYEVQKVLTDVSFEIKKGEFFGIVGRNGSGKSTLLKLIAGIYVPDKGLVQVNGSLTPFIELGVGFNPELTGRENVFLNGALLGFSKSEMDAMYDDIVDFAELEKSMDQKLKNYSSGMQVRLAFSIAIRAKSDILLLDEVLAVGDAAFQSKCYDYFMELKRNKKTVILVTHDMGAVRDYCDRAVMIDKGVIVKSGRAETIAQAYQKMFSDEITGSKKNKQKLKSAQNGINPSESHWGNGKMDTHKPVIKVDSAYVTITTSFKANESLSPPVFGFTVYGPKGENVLESNTKRLYYKTESMNTDEVVEITWRIPNIFASGLYNISVAACDQSTTEFYDWYNHAGSFDIFKEKSTAGVVDPDLKITKYDKRGTAW